MRILDGGVAASAVTATVTATQTIISDQRRTTAERKTGIFQRSESMAVSNNLTSENLKSAS